MSKRDVFSRPKRQMPEAALEALADQNIPFTLLGKASYEQQMAALEVLQSLQFNDGRAVSPRMGRRSQARRSGERARAACVYAAVRSAPNDPDNV